jgi:hypothetical protein
MRALLRSFVLGAGASVLLTLSSLPTAAQPTATEDIKRTARQLANQGEERFKAGDYKQALELFRKAEASFHAPPLVLMQAHSQAKMGALLEARALYEQVVREELGPSSPARFRAARDEAIRELESLKSRIPTVRIVVTRPPDGARVDIDGTEVPAARLANPIELNPGPHTITAAGRASAAPPVAITLLEGARETVNLVFPADLAPTPTPLENAPFFEPPPGAPPTQAPPPSTSSAPYASPPPPPSPPPPSPPPPPNPNAAGSLILPVTAFGIGAAGLVTGVVAGVGWINKDSDIRGQCSGTACPDRLQPDIDGAKLIGRLALTGFIVGLAGVGVGTTLLLVSSSQASAQATGSTMLVIGPGSVGLHGSF